MSDRLERLAEKLAKEIENLEVDDIICEKPLVLGADVLAKLAGALIKAEIELRHQKAAVDTPAARVSRIAPAPHIPVRR